MNIVKVMTIVFALALTSAQAFAQSAPKENKTLADAKAYTDTQVAAEATQRAGVDNGLQGQIDGLQGQVNELASAPSPIIMMHKASDFGRFANPTNPTRVDYLGHISMATGDGSVVMGLIGPASVGGVFYQLRTVEYCLVRDLGYGALITRAVVLHDTPGAASSPLAAAAIDVTARKEAGCYTLAVPALSPRGYSLGLVLEGQTTNLTEATVWLSNVRTTWVAVGP